MDMEKPLYYYIKDYKKTKVIRIKNLRTGLTILAFGFVIGFLLTNYSFNANHLGTGSTRALENSSNLKQNLISGQKIHEDLIINTPSPTLAAIATPISTPAIVEETPSLSSPKKIRPYYKIAFLGDSMVDTFGKGYPTLAGKLVVLFPQSKFDILNYGVGAADMVSGLSRLTNNYVYLNENIPSLLSQNPDIIFVESFAYNHWSKSEEDLNKQWVTLGKIVDTIKSHSGAKIVFYSTIAPNSKVYAKGVKDIGWNDLERKEQSETVKIYLNNHLNFAKSAGIPFIDAYHASIDAFGEGKLLYINSGDLLHPSNEGHALVASMIAGWMFENL